MLFGALFVLYFMAQVFSFLMEGERGFVATELSIAVSADAIVFPVASIDGFPASEIRVFVEDEEVSYLQLSPVADALCLPQEPASFGGPPCLSLVIRGVSGSEITAHPRGAKVFNVTSGLINQAVSFKVGNTNTLVGKIAFPFLAGWALLKFVASAVMWDYQFLDGNGVYFKMLMYFVSFMMIVALVRLLRGGGSFPP